jgi:hypothetical protein
MRYCHGFYHHRIALRRRNLVAMTGFGQCFPKADIPDTTTLRTPEPDTKVSSNMEKTMTDAKLLSEPKNYAIVQLPQRRFPGVVFQGDSLNILINGHQSGGR